MDQHLQDHHQPLPTVIQEVLEEPRGMNGVLVEEELVVEVEVEVIPGGQETTDSLLEEGNPLETKETATQTHGHQRKDGVLRQRILAVLSVKDYDNE